MIHQLNCLCYIVDGKIIGPPEGFACEDKTQHKSERAKFLLNKKGKIKKLNTLQGHRLGLARVDPTFERVFGKSTSFSRSLEDITKQ